MPQLQFEEFAKYPQFKGLFVGGCVERGDGSRFRRKAHAHTSKRDALRGWICVLSPKRVRKPSGTPSLLMWHELAHLVSGQGHTAKFERVMRELCGRSDVSAYRKRIAAQRKASAMLPTTYRFQRFDKWLGIDKLGPSCVRGCGRRAVGYLIRIKGQGMRSDAMCEPCARAVAR